VFRFGLGFLQQGVCHPKRDLADFMVVASPDVLENHIRLDPEHQAHRLAEAVEGASWQRLVKGSKRAAEDVNSIASLVRVFFQSAGCLQGLVLERQLQRGAHLWFVFRKPDKSGGEQFRKTLVDAFQPRFEAPHRPQARVDNGRNQFAARGEVPIRSCTRYSCRLGDFSNGRHVTSCRMRRDAVASSNSLVRTACRLSPPVSSASSSLRRSTGTEAGSVPMNRLRWLGRGVGGVLEAGLFMAVPTLS